jgi:putative ABC transport system permease protein
MLIQDLRHHLRTLWRQPLFAAVAIGTLALGTGVNVAMFSVVRAVLLRPLPFVDPDRLVRLTGFDRREGAADNLSPADFMDFEREAVTLSRLGAHGWVGSFTVTDGRGTAERVGGVQVTEGFFPTLGVQPALGRLIVPEEDRADGPRVALISHGFWVRRFGADAGVLGRTIAVNARATTIIGVLPADYRHIESNPDRAAEIYLPYQFDRVQPNRGGHFIRAVGRLGDEASVEQARAELEAIAGRLEQQYPVSNTDQGVTVGPLLDVLVRDARPALVMLAAAVGLVLLVACANLANLLLARGAVRQQELAVRTALGAGRARLIRLMLAESLALACVGTAAGVLLAFWSTRAMTVFAAAGLPRADDIRIDAVVLVFAIGVALVSSLAAGLLPALQLSRGDLHETLKQGGRQPSASVKRHAREALIAVEVAMSIVLLVAAGLLVRSLWQLEGVHPGFSVDRVMAMDASLPVARYEEGTQIPFYEELLNRVRVLPGVREVGAINILPLSANYDGRGVQIEDRPVPDGQAHSIQARSVTPAYFRAMQVPLVTGRFFDARDRTDSPLVVIVSESMARRHWPGESALGKRITFNSGIPRDQQQVVGGPGSREVVGVVGDVKHLGLDEGEVPMFYTPHAQQPSYHTMTLVVRTVGEPTTLTSAVRHELAQLDAEIPLYQARALARVVTAASAEPRLRATLLGLFAGLALALAVVGVYGVVAYLVGQRIREIGVRLALGAGRADILRLLVLQGVRPVVAGLVLGLVASFGASRLLQAMLFGVTSSDILTYVAAAGALLAASVAAIVIPARRALRVDPAITLRSE